MLGSQLEDCWFYNVNQHNNFQFYYDKLMLNFFCIWFYIAPCNNFMISLHNDSYSRTYESFTNYLGHYQKLDKLMQVTFYLHLN